MKSDDTIYPNLIQFETFRPWAKQIVGKKFYLNQTILFMTEQIGKAPYSSIV